MAVEGNSAGGRAGDRPTVTEPDAYLLVFQPGSSRLFALPASGEVRIGSAPEATLRLEDEGVRPRHAVFRAAEGELEIVEQHGVEGVCINGERLSGARSLVSGDTVTLGPIVLVYHRRPRRRASCRSAVPLDQLRRRLQEETERSLRTHRPLALLAVALGEGRSAAESAVVEAACGVLRIVDVVGWDGGGELLALLPDTGESAVVPARRLLEALRPLAPLARVGIALCPGDTVEPDGLITGARNAAREAAPGGCALLAGAAREFQLDGHLVLAVDPAMRRVLTLVESLARSDLPVLVMGETGVGKEIVARALHEWSARRAHRLVAINCAAITESLFESELFGHERGAFTGAVGAKPGLLETAAGGTVLLDEIGECSPAVQAKLLRVLETGRINRVGSVEEREVDVRVVASTNRRLEEDVAAGRFRRDLYFRLNRAQVLIPPLRERPLDIPALARSFLAEFGGQGGRPSLRLSTATLQRLALHDWPGNVRELRSLMEFCTATVAGEVLEPEHLPAGIAAAAAPWLARAGAPPAAGALPAGGSAPFEPFAGRRFKDIGEELRELERTRMQEALVAAGGVQTRAARLLGMPLRTFVTKLKQLRPAAGATGGSGPERGSPPPERTP
jgi:two-component system response regulator AtoC